VGGNESFPLRFLPVLSPMASAFELVRRFSNLKSRLSTGVRACIRNAAHVFAANYETEALMTQLRDRPTGVSRLLAYFHDTADSTGAPVEKVIDGPLRIFAGGSLDGRKGVALALHALARAKAAGVKFRYRYGGKGPEFERIKRLTARLGLQEDVLLGESLSGQTYKDELRAAHIYLLPSLRDSAGITLAESMLAGCVPIVADCGGPGQIVSAECGYKLAPGSPKTLVEEIFKTIVSLDQNRNILRQKGPAAAKRIATDFSEQHYRTTVNAVYQSIRSPARPGCP
jgi:glycosyltransferase involved in cell wall biosynthesis